MNKHDNYFIVQQRKVLLTNDIIETEDCKPFILDSVKEVNERRDNIIEQTNSECTLVLLASFTTRNEVTTFCVTAPVVEA